MLNITVLLQDVIATDNRLFEAKDVMLGPEARLANVVTTLDIELAKLANLVGWSRVYDEGEKPAATDLAGQYTKVLHAALLMAARKQWTHLVVLDDQDRTDRILVMAHYIVFGVARIYRRLMQNHSFSFSIGLGMS